MNTTPGPEHHWLQRLVGEWTLEIEMAAAPGQPAGTHTGTEHVRSLGGLWVLCEGRGMSPEGQDVNSVMTLGYDPARGRFVGTFVGSTMTHLWVYEGTLDLSADTLTLDTEGPSFETEGARAPYRDAIRFESDDHRVLTSHYRGADGAWHGFMTAHYRRTR